MESLLGFSETASNLDGNHKLVPWLNWDEWEFVRESIFSSSHDSVSKALRRIAAWKSRGCLPVRVEVTGSIVETQQKDPHFRPSLIAGVTESEEMLSMLYTMAITRLVNGVIEKTRKKREVSIGEAAAAIDVPRMLIDIRHEGSHRELPSLRLLRLASVKALDWLKSSYWVPQKKAIPYANVRKEIKSTLRELAFSLKVKRSSASSSLQVKGKRAKHHEQLIGGIAHGRNKFLSCIACKSQSSKYTGSRKHITRALKNLAQLYSSFSSDVVSVLLDFLLKASNSTDTVDSLNNCQINLSSDVTQAVFDEWKPVITKFSKKEPELLLNLLKVVLDIIESRRVNRDDFGSKHFSLLQYELETQRIGVLSSLFTWLVVVLKGLNSHNNEGQGIQTEATSTLPKPVLIELMRRCFYISDPENHKLLEPALLLCKMVGSSYLNKKLHKLSLLTSLYSRPTEDNPSETFAHQDEHLLQAAEKLQLLKLRKNTNSSSLTIRDENVDDSNTWSVVKSWSSCPIGMVGSSVCLPVHDREILDHKHNVISNLAEEDEEDVQELRLCKKREASCDIEMIDNSSIKRMREAENLDFSETENMNVVDGLKGKLLIDGVWQQVGEQQLQYIKSRVGILVTTRSS